MSYDTEESNDEGNSNDDKNAEKAKSQLPELASARRFGVDSNHAHVLNLGRQSPG